jgi:hypothetical protein
MGQWQRRTFSAPGLTQAPPGPYVGALARRSARVVRVTRRPGSGSIGPYSEWAGQNHIAGAGADQYGNASGSEYDLIEDGSIIEAKVVVLNLCSEVTLHQPKAALERKGFTLVELRDCKRLSERLVDAAELWIISDSHKHLTSDALDAIEAFFREGGGLYIWGDNDPYFADANLVLKRLFRVAMFGDSPGGQVVPMLGSGKKSGLVPGHLVTTGLVNIYEGITIAEVPTTKVLKPLVYGSNGRVVTAYFDQDGCRAIVDGGFTRLYHMWESAGTDRYIINAAAWLLNIERFGT